MILIQDAVGGFEVLNKNGVYVPVTYIPVAFVVSIRDFLKRISNDSFVSTVHHVRNATRQERCSIPLIFSFNLDANVGVIPSYTRENNLVRCVPRISTRYVEIFVPVLAEIV